MARKKSLLARSGLPKGEPEYVPIEVTAGIIGHIGGGIYHSVAGALKELVSNAYDADAAEVVISTDYPDFKA